MDILFIDDHRGMASDYIFVLRASDKSVEFACGVDEAIERLPEMSPNTIIVLDIMMPPGRALKDDEETRLGLETGLVLLKRIRKEYPNHRVLILTNIPEDLKPDVSNGLVKVLRKIDTTPPELVSEVNKINAQLAKGKLDGS